ncbi:uncharacterized protein LOC142775575 [Rhipicephalus microplus]|uniref:uncharacterized protein LOC142775575 n=1 Tax=Rhipicephalus microplus TaxID=6941 RepID=UPI003F6C785F
MDVESPGLPPIPSKSSVATLRKRSGHPSDVNSEDTLIYSTASDESSDESDFVPVARRKAKRRLLTTSSSQKAQPVTLNHEGSRVKTLCLNKPRGSKDKTDPTTKVQLMTNTMNYRERLVFRMIINLLIDNSG